MVLKHIIHINNPQVIFYVNIMVLLICFQGAIIHIFYSARNLIHLNLLHTFRIWITDEYSLNCQVEYCNMNLNQKGGKYKGICTDCLSLLWWEQQAESHSNLQPQMLASISPLSQCDTVTGEDILDPGFPSSLI